MTFDFSTLDGGGTLAVKIAADTTEKSYRLLTARSNVTSYSKLEMLHDCPRRFELEMYSSAANTSDLEDEMNLDFAFGHAVGAGIQTYGATKSLQAAQFAAFLAWKAPWDAEKLDKKDKSTGKSLAFALHAVEKFTYFFSQELSDWEVLILDSGKPAIEVSFGVDTENGYYHLGHIDAILQNKETKQLAVWEGKTTGMSYIEPALYSNSYQALGYSVVVDAISKQLGLDSTSYDVLYIVYSSKEREFKLLPFVKGLAQRAEWLQDLLLNHSVISSYKKLNFFPKRGSSCLSRYGKTCKWYGTCNMKTETMFPAVELPSITSIQEAQPLDFTFTLSDLINAQKARA